MKAIKIGLAVGIAALSLAACRPTEVAHRPSEPCSMSQRGYTAPNASGGGRLTCGATRTDRVLRWR